MGGLENPSPQKPFLPCHDESMVMPPLEGSSFLGRQAILNGAALFRGLGCIQARNATLPLSVAPGRIRHSSWSADASLPNANAPHSFDLVCFAPEAIALLLRVGTSAWR